MAKSKFVIRRLYWTFYLLQIWATLQLHHQTQTCVFGAWKLFRDKVFTQIIPRLSIHLSGKKIRDLSSVLVLSMTSTFGIPLFLRGSLCLRDIIILLLVLRRLKVLIKLYLQIYQECSEYGMLEPFRLYRHLIVHLMKLIALQLQAHQKEQWLVVES